MTSPVIEFCHVTKKYGAFAANDDLSFTVQSGSVHAIIGENGAGKTTAMKLLFGLESLTSGEIRFNGGLRPWTSPRGAMASGIGMVHQHFMLSPVHSALDNVILGREHGDIRSSRSWFPRAMSPVQRSTLKSELTVLAQSVGFAIPWDSPAGLLAVGTQQQLEIIKLLHAGVDFMIFDEPTAVLSPDETRSFLEMIKELSRAGRTIIMITHKLKEVKTIADDVTVLRRGKSVASLKCADLSVQDMADLMVGRHVELGELPRSQIKRGESLLRIEALTVSRKGQKNLVSNLDLEIHSGEIVGIAGVEGSGQRELFNFIRCPKWSFPGSQASARVCEIFNENALHWDNHRVRRKPIGIIPADRLAEAVLPEETLLENDLLGHDHEFGRIGIFGYQWLDRGLARQRLQREIATFDVRPPHADARLGSLSGGNQQKFVMARELSRNPKLILCAQPTRGVDVGAIEQIHGELLRRRDQGAGILLISSQLEELMTLADVIHVMFEGIIVATFRRGEFDEKKLGIAMGGGLK